MKMNILLLLLALVAVLSVVNCGCCKKEEETPGENETEGGDKKGEVSGKSQIADNTVVSKVVEPSKVKPAPATSQGTLEKPKEEPKKAQKEKSEVVTETNKDENSENEEQQKNEKEEQNEDQKQSQSS